MQHTLTLYKYQQLATSTAIEYLVNQNEDSVLIQSATGSGKTVISAALISALLELMPWAKFMIVVPSVALVEQFYDTLTDNFGLKPSVLHNQLKTNKHKRPFRTTPETNIIITMPETFSGIITGDSDLKLARGWSATFTFMDEAHKNTAASSQAARDFFPNTKVVGLTATPRREQNKDGEHLWDWYADRLIVAETMKNLIAMGAIVPPVVRHMPAHSVVVSDWLEYTKEFSNKRTMLIAKDTGDALEYLAQFKRNGVRAELVTSGSEKFEVAYQSYPVRQDIFKRFEDGKIDVLVSVDSLCEGFDCKPVQFLIITRRMTSVALIHQTAGRVLRNSPGKTHGYIYDYGNNLELDNIENKVWTHFDYAPEVTQAERGSSLSPKQFVNDRVAYSCVECPHVYDASTAASCPACGERTNIKCKVSTRDILVYCGAETVDSASFRFIKAQVANANVSVGEFRTKKLTDLGTIYFGNGRALAATNPAAILINQVFAKDLNLDDELEFDPHEYVGLAELLIVDRVAA